jgi:CBS domain-containing protein
MGTKDYSNGNGRHDLGRADISTPPTDAMITHRAPDVAPPGSRERAEADVSGWNPAREEPPTAREGRYHRAAAWRLGQVRTDVDDTGAWRADRQGEHGGTPGPYGRDDRDVRYANGAGPLRTMGDDDRELHRQRADPREWDWDRTGYGGEEPLLRDRRLASRGEDSRREDDGPEDAREGVPPRDADDFVPAGGRVRAAPRREDAGRGDARPRTSPRHEDPRMRASSRHGDVGHENARMRASSPHEHLGHHEDPRMRVSSRHDDSEHGDARMPTSSMREDSARMRTSSAREDSGREDPRMRTSSRPDDFGREDSRAGARSWRGDSTAVNGRGSPGSMRGDSFPEDPLVGTSTPRRRDTFPEDPHVQGASFREDTFASTPHVRGDPRADAPRRRWKREPLTARDIMTRSVRTARRDSPLREVAQLMRDEDCGVVPIVDDEGCLLGLVTDRDLALRAFTGSRPLDSLRAGDVMTEDLEAVLPDEHLHGVIELMGRRQVRRVPVLEPGDRLVGIIALGDIASRADQDEELQEALERISARRSFWSRLR